MNLPDGNNEGTYPDEFPRVIYLNSRWPFTSYGRLHKQALGKTLPAWGQESTPAGTGLCFPEPCQYTSLGGVSWGELALSRGRPTSALAGMLQADLAGAFHSWVVVRPRVLWSE